jgi:hypothetical protein
MTPRFVQKLKNKADWEAFQKELESRDIKVVSAKKYGNTIVAGKLMTEYDIALDDGKELVVKISEGKIKIIIYDDKVMLDPSMPRSLKKIAREIALLSIKKQLKEKRVKDKKAQRIVKDIAPKVAKQIADVKDEINNLKKELK